MRRQSSTIRAAYDLRLAEAIVDNQSSLRLTICVANWPKLKRNSRGSGAEDPSSTDNLKRSGVR